MCYSFVKRVRENIVKRGANKDPEGMKVGKARTVGGGGIVLYLYRSSIQFRVIKEKRRSYFWSYCQVAASRIV